jgi:hypothetical protein
MNQKTYYTNDGVAPTNINWGSYQYISLSEIVNNFLLNYVGNYEMINNVDRYKVIHHAKLSIKELNYDDMNEIKVLELTVGDDYKYILPSDYVNWVRISLYKNGGLYPMIQNTELNSATQYTQDSSNEIIFDIDGNAVTQTSGVDTDRLAGIKKTPYWNNNSQYNGQYGYNYDGDWYFSYPIYGQDMSRANINPSFRIDKRSGVINFDTDLTGEQVVVEYISDGMENGDDSEVYVNKMFEKYVYLDIKYNILNTRLNVAEYTVNRLKKDRINALRNARIRIGNIKSERILMALRGQNNTLR